MRWRDDITCMTCRKRIKKEAHARIREVDKGEQKLEVHPRELKNAKIPAKRQAPNIVQKPTAPQPVPDTLPSLADYGHIHRIPCIYHVYCEKCWQDAKKVLYVRRNDGRVRKCIAAASILYEEYGRHFRINPYLDHPLSSVHSEAVHHFYLQLRTRSIEELYAILDSNRGKSLNITLTAQEKEEIYLNDTVAVDKDAERRFSRRLDRARRKKEKNNRRKRAKRWAEPVESEE